MVHAISAAFSAPARAPTSLLDQLTEASNANVDRSPDGLVLGVTPGSEEAKISTTTQFVTPVVINLEARPDLSIRLFYGRGEVILNWETNKTELRIHDPKFGNQRGVPAKGSIRPKAWVKVAWTIAADSTRLEVDGVERYSAKGNYKDLAGTIGVGAYGNSSVTVRSLTVTAGRVVSASTGSGGQPAVPPTVQAAAATQPTERIEVEVPAKRPASDAKAPAPVAAIAYGQPDPIERPEFQTTPKRLVKSITKVTSMLVQIAEDGEATGLTSDIIATVPGQSRAKDVAGAGFFRAEGDVTMRTAFEEAMRAVTLRYPLWEPGHIDVSFGEKFQTYGGPSAGTAFGLLVLSCLEGFDIDPKCAVTGDISVDWRVRKVGGVTAKLRGATLDKCLYALIPEDNAAAFSDMALLYGNSAVWNIQVFTIDSLQQASALARTDRSSQVTEAMTLFAGLQPQLTKAEKATLHKPETEHTLQHILELTPNHASAKNVLAMAQGTAPTTLSANGTLYQLAIIFYPYRTLLARAEPITRLSLPHYVTVNARKRLATLRPIAHKDFRRLTADIGSFIDAMDAYVDGGIKLDTLKARASSVDESIATLSNDPTLFEKIAREGY